MSFPRKRESRRHGAWDRMPAYAGMTFSWERRAPARPQKPCRSVARRWIADHAHSRRASPGPDRPATGQENPLSQCIVRLAGRSHRLCSTMGPSRCTTKRASLASFFSWTVIPERVIDHKNDCAARGRTEPIPYGATCTDATTSAQEYRVCCIVKTNDASLLDLSQHLMYLAALEQAQMTIACLIILLQAEVHLSCPSIMNFYKANMPHERLSSAPHGHTSASCMPTPT